MKSSVLRWSLGRRAIAPSLAALAVAIVLVAVLAPADRILGDAVKMVYVHGAIVRVVLLTFVLAGLSGIGYQLFDRPAMLAWSMALERASLVLWTVYLAVSVVTTLQSWGAIAWFEPRWIASIQITGVAVIAYGLGALMKNDRLSAALNAAVAALLLFLLSRAQLVLHPLDPIAASTDVAIKFAYFSMLALWLLVAVQLARGVHAWAEARDARTNVP